MFYTKESPSTHRPTHIPIYRVRFLVIIKIANAVRFILENLWFRRIAILFLIHKHCLVPQRLARFLARGHEIRSTISRPLVVLCLTQLQQVVPQI